MLNGDGGVKGPTWINQRSMGDVKLGTATR